MDNERARLAEAANKGAPTSALAAITPKPIEVAVATAWIRDHLFERAAVVDDAILTPSQLLVTWHP